MAIRFLILVLVLSFFANAQRRSERSGYEQDILWHNLHRSTQDSIAKAIGDSIDNILPDSLAIYLPRVTQYKDTTSLKTATFDSAGTVVNLKQLSSTNALGGGAFQLRPAAEYTVDRGIVFPSGSASFEWVRQAYIDNPTQINAEWYGAVHDNVTDDHQSLLSALQTADALNANMYLPAGIYFCSDTLEFPRLQGFTFSGTGARTFDADSSTVTTIRFGSGAGAGS